MKGAKIIESEIMQFWVDSKSSGLGFFVVTTSLNLYLRILDSSSREVLGNIEITVNDKQTSGAMSMGSGVKKTTKIFSDNLEKFKRLLLEKIEKEKKGLGLESGKMDNKLDSLDRHRSGHLEEKLARAEQGRENLKKYKNS
jgi:hypothetical protein